MKIKHLYVFLVAYIMAYIPLSSVAQNFEPGPLEFGVFLGTSTYNGDLIQQNFTFQKSHPSFGLFAAQEIYNGFGAEVGFNIGKISGADSINGYKDRNLDFQSNIFDAHLLINYNIRQHFIPHLTPYVFVGAAIYHFNPYTYYNNQKVFLQPLGTVGQGAPGMPPKYSLTQFSIPFGIGLKYDISTRVSISALLSFRQTFTDYLDDVSGYYVDKNILNSQNPLAAKLAFRGDELPGKENKPYPTGGLRGNPNRNDIYYFTGIKMSFRLTHLTAQQKRAIRQVGSRTGIFR